MVIWAHTACQHQPPVDVIEFLVEDPWLFGIFPNKGAIWRQAVRRLYHADILTDYC